MEIQRHGNMDKWRHEDMETWTWRHGDMDIETETCRHERGDIEFFAHSANVSLSFVHLLMEIQSEVIRLQKDYTD